MRQACLLLPMQSGAVTGAYLPMGDNLHWRNLDAELESSQ